MKKETILYDATILAQGLLDNRTRNGIYFVCKNILIELLKRKDVGTICYIREDLMYLIENLREEDCFKNLRVFKEVSYLEKKLFSLIIKLKKLRRKKNFITKNALNLVKLLISISVKLLKIGTKEDTFKSCEITNFISTIYKIPNFIKEEKSIKSYLMIHDVIPLVLKEYSYKKGKGGWFEESYNSLNKDSNIITVSDFTKKDLITYNKKVDKNKIFTAYNSASDTFYQCKGKKTIAKALKKYDISTKSKYIFSLCNLEPRKNLIHTAKCFVEMIKKNKIDDLYFVLGGGSSDKFLRLLEKEVKGLKRYSNRIIRIGYVDDEDLAPLYSKALFFVYPSLYEGFGLPPLEAMKCGTPVITSNTSSLPEVVGDAGIMVNPKNKKQLIDAMYKLYTDEVLRKELSKKGLKRAKKFSWKNTVDTILSKIKNN